MAAAKINLDNYNLLLNLGRSQDTDGPSGTIDSRATPEAAASQQWLEQNGGAWNASRRATEAGNELLAQIRTMPGYENTERIAYHNGKLVAITGNDGNRQMRSILPGSDGTLQGSQWRARPNQSTGQMLTEFAVLSGLALTGLGAAGAGPLAGAFGGGGAGAGAAAGGATTGAGSAATNAALIDSALGTAGYGASSAGVGGAAAAGGGLTLGGEVAAGGGATGGGGAVGGSGLTLGGAPSGAGLTATPGSGLTLASPTGTGAGLTTGGGAVAGGSTLPGWLTNGVTRQVGGRVLGAVLGGTAAGAAAGSGNVNTGNLQGIANTLGQLGTEQADIARALYRDAQGRITINDGIFSQIIQNALTQQTEQAGRSDMLWDTYVSDFLPNAQKFANTALNYDTAGRRAEAGASARASVETEAAMQRASQQRALGRGGISLDSGRALAMDNASRFNATKLSTGADADARRKVEETGLNLNLQAANIGQGIVGTSQQQAGQSLTAGNTAAGVTATREGTRNTTLQPSLSFYGGATSATGGAGNVLNGVANIDRSNRDSRNAGWAGIGEAAGTILTAPRDSVIGGAVDWLFGSDPKTKTVHGKVSGKRTLAEMEDEKVSRWTYKPGLGDGGTHDGRMAGKRDPMGADGTRKIDGISELGRHHAAIVELAKDVKTIKRRLSLADA